MKKLIIIFILALCATMANAQVKVLGKIEPNGPTDTYPTHVDSLGRGGFVAVKTWQERNNIPLPRRKAGMMVSVKSATVDSLYRLGVGLTNADWLPYNPTVDISGKANTDGSNTVGTWPIGINGSAMKWGPLDFTYINAGTIPTHFLVSENIDDGVIKYSDVGDVKTALSISLQDVTDFGNTTNNKLVTSNSIEWGTGTYEVGKSKLFNTASDGTILVPKSGTGLDFTLTNSAGSGVFSVPHGTLNTSFYGDVGIGTGVPTAKLHVAGTSLLDGLSAIGSTTTDQMLFVDAGSSTAVNNGVILNVGSTNGMTSKNLILQNAGGNVGIGITSPSEKLDINGNVKAYRFKVDGGDTISELISESLTITDGGSVSSSTLGAGYLKLAKSGDTYQTTVSPIGTLTANRTIYIPDVSGTLATMEQALAMFTRKTFELRYGYGTLTMGSCGMSSLVYFGQMDNDDKLILPSSPMDGQVVDIRLHSDESTLQDKWNNFICFASDGITRVYFDETHGIYPGGNQMTVIWDATSLLWRVKGTYSD